MGSNDNDSIFNSGANVTIQALGGNDDIGNIGENVTIDAGDGKDTVAVSGNNDNISINGGTGNDYLSNWMSGNVTLNGGKGNDTIYNYGSSNKIFGGTGNDSIYLRGGKRGELIIYNEGDGSDVITGFREDSTLKVDSGSYVSAKSGNDILVRVGNSITTLKGAATLSKVNIVGTPDTTKTFNNSNDYAIIIANDADNNISNGGYHSTLLADGGNDSIYNSGFYISIDGGDGNDVVYGFKSDSTLNLAGTGYVSTKSGDDIILTVTEGKITLAGAAKLSKVNVAETKLNRAFDKSNISIIGTAYDDTITNSGENVMILAQGGNDSLNNYAQNVTIASSSGNDLISLNKSAKNNVIVYNNGDNYDTVNGFNSTSTLNINGAAYASASVDDDVLVRVGSEIVLTLKSAADLEKVNIAGTPDKTKNFSNSKNDTIIIANEADNNIFNNADKVKIYANGGNDSINNAWGADTITIEAGDGKDTVLNYGSVMTINAGDGDDYIHNHGGNHNKYDGGSGNDTIISEGSYSNSTILGGRGNDFIKNEGSGVAISGGDGNDTITNSGANVMFNYDNGDGNDVIQGFKANSTLNLQGLNYSTEKSGADVIVYVGRAGDEIILKDAANLSGINILGTEDKSLYFTNQRDGVSVVGGNYSDTITNNGKNVTVLGLAGNDSIYNHYYSENTSINGGKGNDTIENITAYYVTIDGDAGNDYILGDAGRSTIIGGSGNDTIINRHSAVSINAGTGNDSIFNDSFRVSINAGDGNDSYSARTSGNDIIVTFGEGNITLAGAATLTAINILGVPRIIVEDSVDNRISNALIIGDESANLIKNFGANSTIEAGDGDDSIFNELAAQNVSINAGDDCNYIENSAPNVTISGGANDDSIQNTGANALFIYNVGDGSDFIEGFNGTSTLSIAGGVYSNTTKSGANIIVTIGEDEITLKGAASLSTVNISELPVTVNNSDSNVALYGSNVNDSITNSGKNVTINANGGDDSISNSGANVLLTYKAGDGNDYIYNNGNSNTIDGGAGNDTVNIEWGLFSSISGAAGDDAISITAGAYVTINAGAGNDTIINGHSAQDVIITANDGNDYIYNNGNSNTIDGGAGNDTVNIEWGLFSSISGAAGDDAISITAGAYVTINAGKGNDTIFNDDSDTVLFQYKAGDGNDLVKGFKADSTLSIGSNLFSTLTNDDDVIVTVGKNKITLEGAADLDTLNIVGTEEKEEDGTYVTFTVAGSEVTYETDGSENVINEAYQFNKEFSLLTLKRTLQNYIVTVENQEEEPVKVNWHFGAASLSSASVLKYRLDNEKNSVTLTSKNCNDKITFDEDATFNYGEIKAAVTGGSELSTKGEKEISFDNNSSAFVTAPEGSQINIGAGTFTFNNLPVNSTSGAGVVTVERDGLTFNGYGVQVVDLEIAKESYFGKLAPMTAAYRTSDKSFTELPTRAIRSKTRLASKRSRTTSRRLRLLSATLLNLISKSTTKNFGLQTTRTNSTSLRRRATTSRFRAKRLTRKKSGA